MRLSDAIRLSIGVVQEDRSLFLYDPNYIGIQGTPCGCAIGTALYSIGKRFIFDPLGQTEEQWPWTMEKIQLPPCLHSDHKNGCSISVAISHLHCAHGWSREAIADWLDTIDPTERVEVEANEHMQVSHT